MKLHNETAEFFIPDNNPIDEALTRTTHMCFGAHQDDIEIMAYDGIAKCFGNDKAFFTGVIVTNGAGSPRDGIYCDYTDLQMQNVRKSEQKKAAYVGEYTAMALLDYKSSEVKDPTNDTVVHEIISLIKKAQPEVIYTHNLADKHDTHVGVAINVIRAIRSLDMDIRPKLLFGCEVWRGLDWMNDDDKVIFDVDTHPNIAASLVEIYDSQIIGGKRYDMATVGRRLANATYAASHGVDTSKALIYGMDLTPLIQDDSMDICAYVNSYMSNFVNDVTDRISKLL